MSATHQDLENVRASATPADGPWFFTIIDTEANVTIFANISPPLPPGGLVVTDRADGQFDVWWRLP